MIICIKETFSCILNLLIIGLYIFDFFYKFKEIVFIFHCSLHFLHIHGVCIVHFPETYYSQFEQILLVLSYPFWDNTVSYLTDHTLIRICGKFRTSLTSAASSSANLNKNSCFVIFSPVVSLYKIKAFMPANSRILKNTWRGHLQALDFVENLATQVPSALSYKKTWMTIKFSLKSSTATWWKK